VFLETCCVLYIVTASSGVYHSGSRQLFTGCHRAADITGHGRLSHTDHLESRDPRFAKLCTFRVMCAYSLSDVRFKLIKLRGRNVSAILRELYV